MTPTLTPFHGGVHPPNTNNSPAKRQSAPPACRRCCACRWRKAWRARAALRRRRPARAQGPAPADADGAMSVAVHAPTSGVVRAIGPLPLAHPPG